MKTNLDWCYRPWVVLHQYLTKDRAGQREFWVGLGIDSKHSKCSFNSGAKYSSTTLLVLLQHVMDISLDKWEDGSDSSFLMLCTTADLSLS